MSPEHEQIVIKTGSLSSSGCASDSPPGGALYPLVALKEDIMSRGTAFSIALAVGLLGGFTSLPHYLNIQVLVQYTSAEVDFDAGIARQWTGN